MGGKKKALIKEEPHFFGGCNTLLQHYQTIGSELCNLDTGWARYGLTRNYENFRLGVTVVPIEVLESYFDDLLEIDVPEERLFIKRRTVSHMFQIFAIVGLVAAFAWGLWSVARGASPIVSFVLTIFMSAPFAILWHFSPRLQLIRRLGFARIVSQEIFRRRGGGKDESAGRNRPATVIGELLSTPTGPTVPGAARTLIH